jgi:lipid II:glycine glycyltransferase (peptidoglycan interpeptide bridge formation enzyme)
MTVHPARNEESWDDFVITNGGGFLQSWGWAQFQEAAGREVYRIRIDSSGKAGITDRESGPAGQMLVIMHRLPFGRGYAYLPHGPVVGQGPDARAKVYACIRALRDTMRRHYAVFARVDLSFASHGDVVGQDDLYDWGFEPVPAVQPEVTLVVDLEKGEDELLAEMHHKTRYNIRLAEKRGVTYREADRMNAHQFRHEVELFWKMLGETSERNKFHTHPRDYYEKMLDVLTLKKNPALNTRLVFAEHDGEAVAAAIIAEYGDRVTYLHGASVAARRELMGPHLLHWRAMTEAKKRGFRKYDFWGIAATDDPEHPWAGITRFKRGFGGETRAYLGAWELPGDRFWYNLYRHAKRFKRS